MIQIYSPSNTNFSYNGDAVLHVTDCTATSELNGAWTLELKCPVIENSNWEKIVENAIVSVPTFMGKNQLYRLYEVHKTDSSIDAYGRPIFFDAADEVFLVDSRPTQLSGQAALDWLMNGTAFSGTSNITKVETAYYVRKNLIEALQGDDANSFVKRWGGEPLYNNRQIILNTRAGNDNGVQILYGKNIESIDQTINTEEIITRIYPIAYNGRMISAGNLYVDSPLINSYPKIYKKLIKFEHLKLREDVEGEPDEDDVIYDTVEELNAALIANAQQKFTEGCDKPNVTLDISMVDLAQTDEYRGYAVLETVRLGDTVHCRHSKLGIVTDVRVVGLTWDCVHDCIMSVTLGDPKYDYFSAVSEVVESVKNVMSANGNIIADRVAGILDLTKAQLKLQRGIAANQTVRAILFEDLDPDSPTYGALCIGTQGIEIASTRNTYDTDWEWTTAIDSRTVHAENMISGLLSDRTGSNYWNLDTGEFRLASTGLTVDGEDLDNYIENVASQADALIMYLTAEFIGTNPDEDGTVHGCQTTASVYYGQTDVTSQCQFYVTESTGVIGSWDATNKTYIVSKLVGDEAVVQIAASYLGIIRIQKDFRIKRVTTGANGRAYMLEASNTAIRIVDADGTLSSSYVDFSAFYFDGESTTRHDYAGRFRVEHSVDGNTYETVYESPVDETFTRHVLGSLLIDDDGIPLADSDGKCLLTGPISVKEIRCSLYAEGGFTSLIAQRNVVFLKDAEALTQDDMFDILTNGGQLMGIYKVGNTLYINANYIGTGTIVSPRNRNNYWNLDTGEFSLSSSAMIDGNSGKTIGSYDTRITANASGIATEVADRKSADNGLSSRITQTANSITSEVTNRTNADNALSSRITQNANSITSEVTARTNGDNALSSRITQTANSITSEITNRTNADNALSSRITQTESSIATKITSAQAESIIEQKADSIRLKASKITWSAANSSMDEDGTLRATNGQFTGNITGSTISTSGATGNGRTIVISGGHISIYNNDSSVYSYTNAGWIDSTVVNKDGVPVGSSGSSDRRPTLDINFYRQSYLRINSANTSGTPVSTALYIAGSEINGQYLGRPKIFIPADLVIERGFVSNGDVTINGNFVVPKSYSKSKAMETEDYGERLLYSYETPSPFFGDIGDGQIGEDGDCYVQIDPVFLQTISTKQYQVFLQAYGDGKCYVKERNPGYFIVSGEPGLEFGWEIKAKQIDTDQARLNIFDRNPVDTKGTDYGQEGYEHLVEIENERRSYDENSDLTYSVE